MVPYTALWDPMGPNGLQGPMGPWVLWAHGLYGGPTTPERPMFISLSDRPIILPGSMIGWNDDNDVVSDGFYFSSSCPAW